MRSTLTAAWFILAIIIVFSACNDPELVGSDLIDDDLIEVKSADTFTVEMETILGDDIEVYDQPNIRPARVLTGIINDGFFGRTAHSFYMQLSPPFNVPERDAAVIDSVVLALEYDSTFFYGPADALHSLEVYEVTERIDRSAEYTQAASFQTSAQLLGGVQMLDAKPMQNVMIREAGSEDTLTLAPHLRIRMNGPEGMELAQRILAFDSLVLEDDTLFSNAFNGLFVQSVTESGEVLGFEPRIENQIVEPNAVSGLIIYYHYQQDTSTIYEQFRMTVNNTNALIQHTDMNYENSLAADMLSAPPGSDSIHFLQSMQGLEVNIRFPYLEGLDNLLINHAELEIGIAELTGYSYEDYPPADWINRAEVISVDELQSLDEFLFELSRGVPGFFGGVPVNEEQDTSVVSMNYVFNLTRHIQKIVDGDATETIRLSVQPKLNNAERVMLLGPASGRKPARLRITYTENQ